MKKRLFANKYGYFDAENGEYVIVRPDTPRPWVNVISNGNYGMVISQAGSGYSWLEHAQLNRITRWDQDLTRDNWGKYIYVRDEENGRFWSVTPVPAGSGIRGYRCRHGQGYSVISGRRGGIHTTLTVFVDRARPVEVWLLEIENRTDRRRRLSLFTYLEWCLGVAPDSAREFEKLFISTEFDSSKGVLFAEKLRWGIPDPSGRPWARPYEYTGFHAAVPSPVGFDSDQEAFLGRLGELSGPQALKRGSLQGLQGRWTDGVGSLHCRVNLAPGGRQEVVFLLGAASSRSEAEEIVTHYRHRGSARRELKLARMDWTQRLGRVRVRTPDPSLDLLVNRWLPYQAISCRLWGRSAYYQTGGAYGYRDQLQDSLAALPLQPELCRDHIRKAAAHQFRDGSTLHWWHPITDDGSKKKNSDDLLWLPFITAQYLKETGETAFLRERVSFYDRGKASIRDHCEAAIGQVLGRLSRRGLPIMIEGDWNDGLSCIGYDGLAESVWLGEFLYAVLVEWIAVLEYAGGRNAAGRITEYRRAAQRLKEAINKHAWDGEWYLRALTSGGVLGSRRSRVAKIFLNSQTWAMLYDVVPADRIGRVRKALAKHLYREYGPLLFTPAFDTPDPGIGHLSQYAPGVRENGGLYTHAGCWAVMAECATGNADTAYRIMSSFNPIKRGADPDLYRAEPYVTPGNVDGPESPFFGRGGWTWYTGSAAWLYRAVLDYILGVRPSFHGLEIIPMPPAGWRNYFVARRFRGTDYEINVHVNAKRQGEVRLVIEGEELSGNVIPVRSVPGRVRVEAWV